MKCTRQGCPGRAVWRPMLAMRASVKSSEVEAKFRDLMLCELHKDEARLMDFLSPSSWDRIVRFMKEKGKVAPKRNLTTLRYEMVDSPESTDTETLPF